MEATLQKQIETGLGAMSAPPEQATFELEFPLDLYMSQHIPILFRSIWVTLSDRYNEKGLINIPGKGAEYLQSKEPG